ncbi:hypothetical protein GCM10010124_12870 [Pilimelia terevasa]|uniref:Activator of Hsp90 ATPase homologue 1/2-like C-terminal domain-containing protein n=1 Tax=Pilimelia terevasa TaxID=53372 RepID=A0A8J3BIE7_9ACTN|nr:SRPBCC domain-containing protein [Pilimelia terevasa]GGK21807.1 hypothetical protein GCM10010124_12870 [Pilimelia terevasa]
MNELVVTRLFDAPVALVYRAFVDADQLAQWFGPVGYSVPRDSVEVDARPGGAYRFTMVSDADPAESSPISATFTEVEENRLLVGVEKVTGLPGTEGEVTLTMRVEFHDEGGKTRLVIRQGPFTPELAEMTRQGWESSFTKLDRALAAA